MRRRTLLLAGAASAVPSWAGAQCVTSTRGAVLEETRTNLYLRSGQMEQAPWTPGAATATTGTLAPDGSTNAVFLKEDATTAQHLITQAAVNTTGVAWTYSIFAKAGARSALSVTGLGLGALPLTPAWNLATGTDVSTGTNAAFFHGIQAVGNGWYRCWFTFSPTNTTAPNYIINNPALTASYAGDNVSGLYLWGASAELGAFPTSYIPTVGASATRLTDSCSMPTR